MLKTFSLPCLIAACTLTAGTLLAQNRATIDLLEQKGYITQTEHNALLARKEPARAPLTPAHPGTTQFTIMGYVQAQYNFLHVRGGTLNPNPPDNNGFEIRRALVNFSVKTENNFGAYLTIVSDATYRTRDFLENAAITYTAPDYGTATAGYRKVKFAMEEVAGANDLPAIERSIVTNYFTTGTARRTGTIADRRLGFANRHVGLYWDGKIGKENPLEYGAAATNGYTDSVQFASSYNNNIALWAYLQQTLKYSDNINLVAGLNFGWNPSDDTAAAAGDNADTIGCNPFIKTKIANTTLLAELLGAWVNNGRIDTRADADRDALPWGINLVAAHRIGFVEPVLRYCYLDTDGRGTPMGVWRWNATPNEGIYARAQTIYAGVNFYTAGDAIKISIGYEHGRFSGTPDGISSVNTATGDGVRAQFQTTF